MPSNSAEIRCDISRIIPTVIFPNKFKDIVDIIKIGLQLFIKFSRMDASL